MDAEQGKGGVGEFLDERPLVGPVSPSGQSVFLPEVQQNDFPAIVCQFK